MDGFLTQTLTMLGFQLPELLACVAGAAMLWTGAPRVPGRPLALAGMLTLLAAALLRLATSIGQTWLIHNAAAEGYASLSGRLAMFSALGILLGIASAVGLVLLVWGACKAMRAAAASRAA